MAQFEVKALIRGINLDASVGWWACRICSKERLVRWLDWIHCRSHWKVLNTQLQQALSYGLHSALHSLSSGQYAGLQVQSIWDVSLLFSFLFQRKGLYSRDFCDLVSTSGSTLRGKATKKQSKEVDKCKEAQENAWKIGK
jgi:hypothetical protein